MPRAQSKQNIVLGVLNPTALVTQGVQSGGPYVYGAVYPILIPSDTLGTPIEGSVLPVAVGITPDNSMAIAVDNDGAQVIVVDLTSPVIKPGYPYPLA